MKSVPYLSFIVVYYGLRLLSTASPGLNFYIEFLNVGQGDSIVMNIPRYGYIVIDTGPDYQSNYLSARKSAFPICQIKSVIITHYDSDHSAGLERVLKYCRNTKIYNSISQGDTLRFGDTYLYILSPPEVDLTREENDDSIIVLLKHDSFEALLVGDAGLEVLEGLSSTVNDLSENGTINGGLDVYKVSHHGSKYNNSFKLINSLKPNNCIISVGKNTFGHPSLEVIKDLNDAGCKVYRTDVDGSVTFFSR